MVYARFLEDIMETLKHILVVCVALGLAVSQTPGQPAGGNVAFFLKLDGIQGDSTNEKHVHEFDVLSFSFGATGGEGETGGGKGAGRTHIKELVMSKRVGTASPTLFLHCASGKHIKSAVLIMEHQPSRTHVVKYTLTDVVISSITHSGPTGKMPSEDISLRFGKIEIECHSTDAKGRPSVIKAGWDVRANKGF